MLFLKKVFAFIKKYWKLLSLVVAVIVGLLFLRKRPTDFLEDFMKIKKIHEDEVEKINEAHRNAALKKEEARKIHDDVAVQIEKDSVKKQDNLNKEKVDEVERLKNLDPNKLAEEVSKVTGFKVILPKDE